MSSSLTYEGSNDETGPVDKTVLARGACRAILGLAFAHESKIADNMRAVDQVHRNYNCNRGSYPSFSAESNLTLTLMEFNHNQFAKPPAGGSTVI